MYNKIEIANKISSTTIKVNNSYEGETIEKKIRRILNGGEPISDGAPLVYTERKDGVKPEFNIRTDRFDIAYEAMDKVSGSHKAAREDRAKKRETQKSIGEAAKEGMAKEGESKA